MPPGRDQQVPGRFPGGGKASWWRVASRSGSRRGSTAMRVILEVIKGPEGQAGPRFVFERPGAIVVGRKENDRVQFRIPDDRYVSRYHMIVEANPQQCLLRDLGSAG